MDGQKDEWSIVEGWSCKNHLNVPCPPCPKDKVSEAGAFLTHAGPSLPSRSHQPHELSSWEGEVRGGFLCTQMDTWASILLQKHVSVLGSVGEATGCLGRIADRSWNSTGQATISRPTSLNYDRRIRSWWKFRGHPQRHLNICFLSTASFSSCVVHLIQHEVSHITFSPCL